MAKTAVFLFNLGGPDHPDSVRPFLFNLFNDKAIIGAPWPIRWLLARRISARRAPIAREIYARIGGKSPLLEQTESQARALEAVLGSEYRCFIAMRYWHPMTAQAIADAQAWGAEQAVLLPLYPQFSTTTSGSSLKEWRRQAAKAGLMIPVKHVCCYPGDPGFVAAMAALTRQGWEKAAAGSDRPPRVLFSAHGLPKQVVERGDPYQAQTELSCAAVAAATGIANLDWAVCYQSRVGPLEWIGPSTEAELQRAALDKVSVVVVPIAFVSEHSETLVELDLEYGEMAHQLGIPAYVRVPTAQCHPDFIDGLAKLVRDPGSSHRRACSTLGRSCMGECA